MGLKREKLRRTPAFMYPNTDIPNGRQKAHIKADKKRCCMTKKKVWKANLSTNEGDAPTPKNAAIILTLRLIVTNELVTNTEEKEETSAYVLDEITDPSESY